MSINSQAFDAILGRSSGPKIYKGKTATREQMDVLTERMASTLYLSAVVKIATSWTNISDEDTVEKARVDGCLDAQGLHPYKFTPPDWYTPKAHRARAKFAIRMLQMRVEADADTEASVHDIAQIVMLISDAAAREGQHWSEDTYRQATFHSLIETAISMYPTLAETT